MLHVRPRIAPRRRDGTTLPTISEAIWLLCWRTGHDAISQRDDERERLPLIRTRPSRNHSGNGRGYPCVRQFKASGDYRELGGM